MIERTPKTKWKDISYSWIGRFDILFIYSFFLGPHLYYMEVSRLGVELELQLPAYATATARPDPSCSLWQSQILNPLSKARHWTHLLRDTSRVLNPLSHNGNSNILKESVLCKLIHRFNAYRANQNLNKGVCVCVCGCVCNLENRL